MGLLCAAFLLLCRRLVAQQQLLQGCIRRKGKSSLLKSQPSRACSTESQFGLMVSPHRLIRF
jgi:hypothetical protein